MKRIILCLAILLPFLATAQSSLPSYIPSNGLVGWWPFNGNALDESGYGHNGIVTGALLVSDRFNSANSAYKFNGSDFIECINPNYQLLNSMSVSAWIKLSGTTTAPAQYLISKGFDYQNGFNLDFDNSTNQFYAGLGIGLSNVVQSFGTFPTPHTIWHHAVFVYDAGNIKFYFDGVLTNTKTYSQSLNLNSDLLYIGKHSLTGYSYFTNGCLDDIGIWSRALSQSEITALYQAQNCSGTGAISADGPTTFCAGNSVKLTCDVQGGTYQWKKNGVAIATNGSSRTYTATATGTYTCVSTCNGTTMASNAIQVTTRTNAAATVSAAGSTAFCAGDSVTLNATNLGANYSVQWYRTNVSMEGATSFSNVVKQPGTYKVVTKNNVTGCSRISATSVVVAVNCRTANQSLANGSIEEEATTAKTGVELTGVSHVFPNPSNGTFTVEMDGLPEVESVNLQVLNTMGQAVYSGTAQVSEGFIHSELQLGNNLPNGIYVVRITADGVSQDSKVIIE